MSSLLKSPQCAFILLSKNPLPSSLIMTSWPCQFVNHQTIRNRRLETKPWELIPVLLCKYGTCIQVYMHIYICIQYICWIGERKHAWDNYIYLYVCMSVSQSVSLYVCLSVCMYVCIHITYPLIWFGTATGWNWDAHFPARILRKAASNIWILTIEGRNKLPPTPRS